MGLEAPKLLHLIFDKLDSWDKNSFKKIDKDGENGNQIVPIDYKCKKIIFTIITHPSYPINQKYRKFNLSDKKYAGSEAEIEILNQAIKEAGLLNKQE